MCLQAVSDTEMLKLDRGWSQDFLIVLQSVLTYRLRRGLSTIPAKKIYLQGKNPARKIYRCNNFPAKRKHPATSQISCQEKIIKYFRLGKKIFL